MWLAVLVLSSIITCLTALTAHQYFQPGTLSLFPTWPQYRDGEIVALLGMTIALLMLPKLLGALLALRDRSSRAAFGGTLRLGASVLLEQTLSMLLAPTMMLFHSSFVIRALLGRSTGWDAQPRSDRGVTWREAFRRHFWHVALGLAWGVVILKFAPTFIWWMLPVVVGMVLPIPFTVLTSRTSIGRGLRSLGLLLTPEEVAPPQEIRLLQSAAPLAALAEEEPRPTQVPQRAPLTMIAQPSIYLLSFGARRRDRRREAGRPPAPAPLP